MHSLRLRDVGSASFTWHDLAVIVRGLQGEHGSQFNVAVHGERVRWDMSTQILVNLMNRLDWIAWTKTKDGSKNRNAPKQFYLPGLEPDDGVKHYGTPDSIENVLDFLGIDQDEFFA